MLDFLLVSSQVLCLGGLLYGGYLCIRLSDALSFADRWIYRRSACIPEAVESQSQINYLGYYS